MADIDVEIEFLPVGDGSKGGDAILVRYGAPFELMLIDGGTTATGEKIVAHVRDQFGPDAYLNHVVLTHTDIDHSSGLREVLKQLVVSNLWINVPWLHASEALPPFSDKRLTARSLHDAIIDEYDIVREIVEAAQNQGTTEVAPLRWTSDRP